MGIGDFIQGGRGAALYLNPTLQDICECFFNRLSFSVDKSRCHHVPHSPELEVGSHMHRPMSINSNNR